MAIQLNEEQQVAFENMLDFIKNGDHKTEYYTLSGKAGTGKTFCLAKLVEALPNRRFIVSAISHKAKENIAQRITSKNVKPMTIAALLAMKMDMETGKFSEDPYAQDIPIADADIVIIDEASMLDEKSIKYMFTKKLYRTVLIFAGDIGQIRPIRENGTSKLFDVSPVFNCSNISFLNTRVRQGEGNPILSHMDYYWDMTRNPEPLFDELQRPNEENEIGSIKYTNDMRNVIRTYLNYFKEATETNNTNIIKIGSYTNSARKKINDMVREAIYIEPQEYEIGELMVMNDTYQVDRFTRYENSLEFSITSFRKDIKTIGEYMFDYFDIRGVTSSGYNINIPVLAEKDKEKFSRLITKMFAEAKELQGVAKRNAYSDAWAVSATFAKAEYGYCQTLHKL